MSIKIDNQNIVNFRYTGWDEKVLNGKTIEITDIQYSSEEFLTDMFNMLVKEFISSDIVFANCRVSPTDFALRKLLAKTGFIHTETSLHLSKTSSLKIENNLLQQMSTNLEICRYESDFKSDIIENLNNDFHYGRFLEDPYISITAAKKRNVNWFFDMINQKEINIYIGLKNKKYIGFMAVRETTAKTDLLLGGVRSIYSHLSFPFWTQLLLVLSENSERFETVISAANTGAVNLYSKLNFNFEKTVFGFHWHKH